MGTTSASSEARARAIWLVIVTVVIAVAGIAAAPRPLDSRIPPTAFLAVGAAVLYAVYQWTPLPKRKTVTLGVSFADRLLPPDTCPACQLKSPASARRFRYKEVLASSGIKGPFRVIFAAFGVAAYMRHEYQEDTRTTVVTLSYCLGCKWLDLLWAALSALFVVISVGCLFTACLFLLVSCSQGWPLNRGGFGHYSRSLWQHPDHFPRAVATCRHHEPPQ